MSTQGPRATTRARNLVAGIQRVRQRRRDRRSDPELRQLQSLRRAYSGTNPPELLIFGDSAMFHTTQLDTERRHLADLIRAELGGGVRYEALVGPGYNPRIVGAFLTAIERAPRRPQVVLVPTSVLMAQALFIENPHFAYRLESAAIRHAIASGSTSVSGLPRPEPAEFEEYDRRPAPSLYGARCTAGELRLIVNATPQTTWQKVVRLRHLMDYYNAEALTRESPGVQLVGELGRSLRELGIPAVAYIAPVNHEVLRSTLGDDAVTQLEANAQLIADTFLEAARPPSTAVNAIELCPKEHYADPVHLTYAGRLSLAQEIAAAIRPLLSPTDDGGAQ